ncbi:hypothetical protein ZHAS_00016455 [Anopheles sinensis]|uniref:Uncharacterized protein n=1 Tax=Anopheles sinensis TaxID=74873 RepID=A0A084WE26_ANOSI|nr:hypothetical protein ZHAS_00016455 [Anopheles sinensis]
MGSLRWNNFSVCKTAKKGFYGPDRTETPGIQCRGTPTSSVMSNIRHGMHMHLCVPQKPPNSVARKCLTRRSVLVRNVYARRQDMSDRYQTLSTLSLIVWEKLQQAASTGSLWNPEAYGKLHA